MYTPHHRWVETRMFAFCLWPLLACSSSGVMSGSPAGGKSGQTTGTSTGGTSVPATGGGPGFGGAVGSGGNGGFENASASGGHADSGGVTGAGSGGTSGGSGGAFGDEGVGGRSTGGGGGIIGSQAGSGGTSCTTPPAAGPLIGWAAVDGMSRGTTNGGGNLAPVTVTKPDEFTTLVGGSTPQVIYVMGNFAGTFSIGSNKTLVGLCGARLQGHLSLSHSVNVIVRNLTIIGNNCSDSPSDCSAGKDAVTVGDSSHHVWFDHDDIYDGSDGNMDITSGADFVTVSWCKFHYSTMRTDPTAGTSGHRFSNLIGSADDVPGDVGHLNVTFHHNWWADNIDQRMPRTRHGKIHVFNNLFTAVGNNYCTNAGYMAALLVENNVYIGVKNPLQPDANGDMKAVDNVFQNTTGTKVASGTGFVPTYTYTAETTATLQATIMSQAGPR